MRRAPIASVIAALVCASVASAGDEPELQTSHDVLLATAMASSHGANDLLFAAIPRGTIDDVVLGAFPIRPEDFETALPPPPPKVTLENSYAPVVFSHAGHLSRRTACKACHGEGPVRKIGRFEPRVAHDRCRQCHVTVARGPTDCRGCHLVKPKPEPSELVQAEPTDPRKKAATITAATPLAVPVSVAMLTPGAVLPFSAETATVSFQTAASWPASPGTAIPPDEPAAAVPDPLAIPARHSVFAGASMLAGKGAPTAPAAAVQITIRQEGYQVTESLEWGSRAGARRTLGLVGAGVVRPLRPQWSWHVLGVGGFDALNAGWSMFLPAAGLRAGVEWTSGRPFLHSFDLSVTALSDLARGHDPSGASLGGPVLSVSLSAGLDMRRR
jgi:hypothetical protein